MWNDILILLVEETGRKIFNIFSEFYILNSTIKNITSTDKSAIFYLTSKIYCIDILESSLLNINKVDVSEVNQLVLLMSVSTISSMIKVNISNWTKGIELTQMSTISIYDSTFVNLGSAELYKGAGLQIEDSNLTISKSSFENNSAQNGGVIYLSWKLKFFCSYNISLSSFKNNSAIYQGGAIYYDLYRPGLSENIFEGNSAGYGPNIASYPIKINIRNSNSDFIKLFDVGSGVKYSNSLELALVDYDNQANNLDNSSVITIKSTRSNTSVFGTTLK